MTPSLTPVGPQPESAGADPSGSPHELPEPDASTGEPAIDDLFVEEILIEDLSIDGMCGVY